MIEITEKIQDYYNQSNIFHHEGENERALEYARKAYELLENVTDNKIRTEIAILYCIRLQDYDLRSNWNEIKNILINYLPITRNEDLILFRIKILYLLVDYTYLKREFSEYHLYYGELVDLLVIHKNNVSIDIKENSELISKIYLSRSMYLLYNDRQLSFQYIKKGLVLYKYHKNNFLRMRFYIQMGRFYWSRKNQKCILIFTSLLKKLNNPKFFKEKYNQWDDLALEILFTKAGAESYFNKLEDAVISSKKALEISIEIKSIEMQGESLVQLCSILLKMGNEKEYKKYLKEATDFCQFHSYKDLLEDLKIIAEGEKIYVDRGD